jgi:hypothetical protein
VLGPFCTERKPCGPMCSPCIIEAKAKVIMHVYQYILMGPFCTERKPCGPMCSPCIIEAKAKVIMHVYQYILYQSISLLPVFFFFSFFGNNARIFLLFWLEIQPYQYTMILVKTMSKGWPPWFLHKQINKKENVADSETHL